MPTEGKGSRNNSVKDSLCLLNHSSLGAFFFRLQFPRSYCYNYYVFIFKKQTENRFGLRNNTKSIMEKSKAGGVKRILVFYI